MTKEIAVQRALERFPKSKRIAVENFLWSMMGTDRGADEGNLLYDASFYNWNPDTIGAIAFGIDLYYNALN